MPPVKGRKEDKQKSWKDLLAADVNQDIYSCDRFFCQAKTGLLQLALPYLIHKGC